MTDDLKGGKMKEVCNHEIGRKMIGGFPGHEHTHQTGTQLCLKCGKTLEELFKQAEARGARRILEGLPIEKRNVAKEMKVFDKVGHKLDAIISGTMTAGFNQAKDELIAYKKRWEEK